ncbi:phage neck terminator protein [Psychrobacillus sp. FSL K6-1415]|uniref:phage neck terminator protein n=1 Tax=Psychrobacillus sp. FSL K6-1415 TaxID=2921544 RepID=UPI0030FACD84
MIKYDDIWIPLQNGLSNYTGIEVIQAESIGKQPEYPFISIKKTTIGQNVGQVAESLTGNIKTIEQDVESVFSITCNAATIEDAEDYTHKARAYFLGKGHIDLSDKNITVVDVLNATNRDVFLTVAYERRCGFDLRLRVRGQESYEIDVIERVTIN